MRDKPQKQKLLPFPLREGKPLAAGWVLSQTKQPPEIPAAVNFQEILKG